MANPFPGMDPYLEGDLWTSVHTDLCVAIAHQLAPKLKPKYLVRSTRRVVVSTTDDEDTTNGLRYPDVGIMSQHEPTGPAAGTATAPVVLTAAFPETIPHVSVEIRDAAKYRLITCIELLSPSNKQGTGRGEYEARRLAILSGGAHLVEIDLLRRGARFPTSEALPPAPYFVFVCRVERPSRAAVWPILLEEQLPKVGVPLLMDDSDVELDLQAALSTEYDIMSYDESIDYSQPPPGPLTEEQAAWVDERLRKAGRRK
jgi:hypothetical protein